MTKAKPIQAWIIYVDPIKDRNLSFTTELVSYLLSLNCRVFIDCKEQQHSHAIVETIKLRLNLAEVTAPLVLPITDLVGQLALSTERQQPFKLLSYLALGGDGTFLAAIHKAHHWQIPVLGVRLGRLGFLADVTEHNYRTLIKKVCNSDYLISERLLLNCHLYDPGVKWLEPAFLKKAKSSLEQDFLVFNDVVLNRINGRRIAKLNLQINQVLVDTIPADGIIVCTPSGSTAYALSAGGALIEPNCAVMEISPICPHRMHNRSYITSATSEICLTFPEDQLDNLDLSIDGKLIAELSAQARLTIKRALPVAKIITFKEQSFFDNLEEKLKGR